MSTIATIELYDGVAEDAQNVVWTKSVDLYHHWDGYPEWMGPYLERELKRVRKLLEINRNLYWWNGLCVGALLIHGSVDGHGAYQEVPRMQPCLGTQVGTDYLWRIFLSPTFGEFEIDCFSMCQDWSKGEMLYQFTPVDWQEEREPW
jgi:hypothetical protein